MRICLGAGGPWNSPPSPTSRYQRWFFFPIRCSRAHPPSDKEASSEEPTPHFDPTRVF